MTTDPYKLCPDAWCPHCGVKGRLVAEQETRGNCDYGDDDFELLTCVELAANEPHSLDLETWTVTAADVRNGWRKQERAANERCRRCGDPNGAGHNFRCKA